MGDRDCAGCFTTQSRGHAKFLKDLLNISPLYCTRSDFRSGYFYFYLRRDMRGLFLFSMKAGPSNVLRPRSAGDATSCCSRCHLMSTEHWVAMSGRRVNDTLNGICSKELATVVVHHIEINLEAPGAAESYVSYINSVQSLPIRKGSTFCLDLGLLGGPLVSSSPLKEELRTLGVRLLSKVSPVKRLLSISSARDNFN